MTSRRTLALIVLLGVAFCFALAVVCYADGCEKEEEVTLDQCPTAVQNTLNEQAQGGTIDEIEKSTEDGKVVYEADITKDGKEYEVKVAEDGTLIKSEAEDEDEDDGADED